jgi:hypothetical protein
MGKTHKDKHNQNNKNRKDQERQEKYNRKKERERVEYGGTSWKTQWRKFQDQLKCFGLMIKDVTGDGNCLFRAVADQLKGHPEQHQQIRQETVSFLESHSDDYAPFMDESMVCYFIIFFNFGFVIYCCLFYLFIFFE